MWEEIRGARRTHRGESSSAPWLIMGASNESGRPRRRRWPAANAPTVTAAAASEDGLATVVSALGSADGENMASVPAE